MLSKTYFLIIFKYGRFKNRNISKLTRSRQATDIFFLSTANMRRTCDCQVQI